MIPPVQRDAAASRRAVLEARARILARPIATDDVVHDLDALPILIFAVGEERMAIPVSSIVALVRVTSVTPLPRALAPVYGVMPWRGRPLTALSVGTRSTGSAPSGAVVLGDAHRASAALLVDDFDDIAIVGRSTLTSASGSRAAMSLGITEDAVLVLDADALIREARSDS